MIDLLSRSSRVKVGIQLFGVLSLVHLVLACRSADLYPGQAESFGGNPCDWIDNESLPILHAVGREFTGTGSGYDFDLWYDQRSGEGIETTTQHADGMTSTEIVVGNVVERQTGEHAYRTVVNAEWQSLRRVGHNTLWYSQLPADVKSDMVATARTETVSGRSILVFGQEAVPILERHNPPNPDFPSRVTLMELVVDAVTEFPVEYTLALVGSEGDRAGWRKTEVVYESVTCHALMDAGLLELAEQPYQTTWYMWLGDLSAVEDAVFHFGESFEGLPVVSVYRRDVQGGSVSFSVSYARGRFSRRPRVSVETRPLRSQEVAEVATWPVADHSYQGLEVRHRPAPRSGENQLDLVINNRVVSVSGLGRADIDVIIQSLRSTVDTG